MTTSFRGEMLNMGGRRDNRLPIESISSAIWTSPDGLARTQRVSAAPWGPRIGASLTTNRDQLWILGGGDWDSLIGRADVWSSFDGVQWTQHADAPWQGRIWHTCQSYAGRIWQLGGYLLDPILSVDDIWSTVDGDRWLASTDSVRPAARHATFSVVHADRLWLIGGGANNDLPGDVWAFHVP